MPQDLYKTLNVDKSASKKEINSAFKKLAVIHHPDKNGGKQTAEFDAIKRAYDTLNNDNDRRMYDEFGVIPGDDESNRKMLVISALCQVFATIVGTVSASQLERTDLIGMMKTQITASKQTFAKQKIDLEKKLKSFQEAHAIMKKRLKHKIVGGEDFLMKAIEENIRSFPSNIINAEKQVKLHDEMHAMLSEYEYEFEKAQSLGGLGGGLNSAEWNSMLQYLAGQI